jgi:hypothetical protein
MTASDIRAEMSAGLRRRICAALLALTPATFSSCIDSQCTTFDANCGASGPVLLNLLYNPELTLIAVFDASPAQSELWFWRNRDWTRVGQSMQPFPGAAYHDARFLAANLGQFWQSRDGRSWTTSPFPGELSTLAFANGRLVGGETIGAFPTTATTLRTGRREAARPTTTLM